MTDMLMSTDGGKTTRTMGEALAHSLAGRRMLMLARDRGTADSVEKALRDHDVPVQRLTADERGLAAPRLADDEGRPSLPTGAVAIVDLDSWQTAADTRRVTRAAEAVMDVVSAAHAGSTVDHLLTVTPEQAMEDALATMNRVMDRMVEAEIVDDLGGPDRLPGGIRRFMTWLPRRDVPADARPTGAQTIHSTIDMLDLVGRAPSDELLDRLFGDDVLEHERKMRSTYVLRDEDRMMDMPICAAELPERGYDFRRENEAFNRRHPRAKGRGRR